MGEKATVRVSRIPIRHVSATTPQTPSPLPTFCITEAETVHTAEPVSTLLPLANSTQVEQQMDMEVEKVLREWDSNVQCRTQDTFSLRSKPSPTKSPAGRSRKRFSQTTPKHDNLQRRVFEFPEIDVIRRQDTSFDTSNDTIEDDPRTPLYISHPQTGERIFHMEFDIEGFDENNVTVKVSGSRLVIHAIRTMDGDGKKSSTEFCRKIKLPKDVDRQQLQCNYNGDTKSLIVEAPIVSNTPSSSPAMPNHPVSSPKLEALNQPLIRPGPEGRMLHLAVEVGRVFKSGDVVVKVRGQNKIVITAEREESNMHSKLSANLSREFDLSHKIEPNTLKAGLTVDGLLRITAAVLDGSDSSSAVNENTPVGNGQLSSEDGSNK